MNSHFSQTLIGQSKVMERLRQSIRKVAAADLTVLIYGQTGTGKELVAHAIHDGSRRANGPFVALNCGGVQDTLVESELFGYEKGAFTGADAQKKGRFEQANGGTLFLDEIGEISPLVQVKLLRVLQEHEIDRVGGHKPVPVDFRLVAATNRDLEEMVRARQFREDLYFRLNACLIQTPSLADRPEDIVVLALHFCRHDELAVAKGFSSEVLEIFQNYGWPGNVRELQNVVQYAVRTCEGEVVQPEDLAADFLKKSAVEADGLRNYDEIMEKNSRVLCAWALGVARGNFRKAARLLGLSRSTFHRIAKGHGLGDPLNT